MTASPETPETNNPEEEVVEAAPKKPVRKRKPAAKKPAAKKPAEEHVPTAEELKEKFAEAAVEPTKKVIDTWSEIADVVKTGLTDLKEFAFGSAGGFLGNTKKKDED